MARLHNTRCGPHFVNRSSLTELTRDIERLKLIGPLVIHNSLLITKRREAGTLHGLKVAHTTICILPYRAAMCSRMQFGRLRGKASFSDKSRHYEISNLRSGRNFIRMSTDRVSNGVHTGVTCIQGGVTRLIVGCNP